MKKFILVGILFVFSYAPSMVNEEYHTSFLYSAVELNRPYWTKRLIQLGANVNGSFERKTPLMIAATRGHYEIAKLLLEASANITIRKRKKGINYEICGDENQSFSAKDLAKEQKHYDIVSLIEEYEPFAQCKNKCSYPQND